MSCETAETNKLDLCRQSLFQKDIRELVDTESEGGCDPRHRCHRVANVTLRLLSSHVVGVALIALARARRRRESRDLLFTRGFMDTMTTPPHPFVGNDQVEAPGVWQYERERLFPRSSTHQRKPEWVIFDDDDQALISAGWHEFLRTPRLDEAHGLHWLSGEKEREERSNDCCTAVLQRLGVTPAASGVTPLEPCTTITEPGTVDFEKMCFVLKVDRADSFHRLRKAPQSTAPQVCGKAPGNTAQQGHTAANDGRWTSSRHNELLRGCYNEMTDRYSSGTLDMLAGMNCGFRKYYLVRPFRVVPCTVCCKPQPCVSSPSIRACRLATEALRPACAVCAPQASLVVF